MTHHESTRTTNASALDQQQHFDRQLFLFAFATMADVAQHVRMQGSPEMQGRLPEIQVRWLEAQAAVRAAIEDEAELVSIGTLLAFVIVCAGVWYLRVKEPDRERPFRTPLVPILGITTCVLMMLSLPADTWLRLFVWLALGLVIYFVYGRHHSTLRRESEQSASSDRKAAGVL